MMMGPAPMMRTEWISERLGMGRREQDHGANGHETILGRGGAPAGVRNACHWLVRHKHKRPAMEHEPGRTGEAKVLPKLLGCLQVGCHWEEMGPLVGMNDFLNHWESIDLGGGWKSFCHSLPTMDKQSAGEAETNANSLWWVYCSVLSARWLKEWVLSLPEPDSSGCRTRERRCPCIECNQFSTR